LKFEGIDGTALQFGSEFAVVAECTWQATGERLRLPFRRVVVGNISVAITSSSSSAGSVLVVDAYMAFNVSANLTDTTPGAQTNITVAGAMCVWALVSAGADASGASDRSAARLGAATAAVAISAPSMRALTANPLPVVPVVEGPPVTSFGLQLVCTMWSNVVTSNVLPCVTGTSTRTYRYLVPVLDDARQCHTTHNLAIRRRCRASGTLDPAANICHRSTYLLDVHADGQHLRLPVNTVKNMGYGSWSDGRHTCAGW